MSRKILLADDSVTAQNMGKKILSDAGYEVITVSNGSAALKKIAELKPDIAVLDVYMPGHSGLEVCKQLKANPETVNIPVLLTVGKLEPFKSDEALKAKANAFIIKPFEASELLAVIRKIEDANPKPAAKSTSKSTLAKAFAANAVAEEPNPDAEIEVTGWKNRISMPGKKKEEPDLPEEDFPGMGTGFRDIAPVPEEASGLRRDSSFTADALAENKAVERPKVESAAAEHPLRAANKEALVSKVEAVAPPAEGSSADLALDITPAEIAAIKAAVKVLSGEGDNAPVLHVAAAALEGIKLSHRELAPEPEYPAEILADPEALTRNSDISETRDISESEATKVATGPFESPVEATAVEETASVAVTEQEIVQELAAEPVVTVPPVTRWCAEVAELTPAEASASLEQEMRAAIRASVPETDAHTYNLAQFAEPDIPSPVDDEPALSDIPGLATLAAESEPETLAVAAAASGTNNLVSNVGSTSTPEDRASADKPFTQNFAAVRSLAPDAAPAIAPLPAPQVSTGFQDLRPHHPEAPGGTTASTATGQSAQVDGFVEMASLAAPAPSVDRSAPEDEIDSRTKAQMDAAWSNWHDIRNTIVKPELTDQIAEVAEASAKAEAQATSDASRDTSDIANIVDNMLAEMRPKLLEEIARKLAANKKE